MSRWYDSIFLCPMSVLGYAYPFSAWSLSPEVGREQVADVKAIEIANLDLILKSTYYSFTGSG